MLRFARRAFALDRVEVPEVVESREGSDAARVVHLGSARRSLIA